MQVPILSDKPSHRVIKLGSWFCPLPLVLFLAFSIWRNAKDPYRHFPEPAQLFSIALTVTFPIVPFLLRFRSLRFACSVISLWTLLSLALVIGLDLRENALRASGETIAPVGIWHFDSRYGYSHLPNSKGTHHFKDSRYDVTYTIDSSGARITPTPRDPKGRIAILGCSFAFGYRVEDEACFPHRLGVLWPQWKVENWGVSGWGTAHAYLKLQNLIQRDPQPAVVLYAMHHSHILRNYVRASWIHILQGHHSFGKEKEPRGHPHFELSQGEPRYLGIITTGGVPDSPELLEKEVEMTRALLLSLKRLCDDHHIRFGLILFGEKGGYRPFLPALREAKVPMIDCCDLKMQSFPYDHHPNAKDHRRIAERIAASFVSEWIQEPLK